MGLGIRDYAERVRVGVRRAWIANIITEFDVHTLSRLSRQRNTMFDCYYPNNMCLRNVRMNQIMRTACTSNECTHSPFDPCANISILILPSKVSAMLSAHVCLRRYARMVALLSPAIISERKCNSPRELCVMSHIKVPYASVPLPLTKNAVFYEHIIA